MDETHQKVFTGVFIPAALWEEWESGRLAGDALLLLMQITSLSKRKEGCTASNKWLAEHYAGGVDERTIRRNIEILEKAGLAKRTLKGEHRTIRAVPTPPGQKCPPPRTKMSAPPDKNVRQTNPSNYTQPLSAAKPRRKLSLLEGKKPKQSDDGPTPAELNAARMLADAVQAAGAAIARPYPGRPIRAELWAVDLAKLRTVDCTPESEWVPILEWYCQDIAGEWMPAAWSGSGFRKKYNQLRAAYRRANPETGSAGVEGDDIPEAYKALLGGWPMRTKGLPQWFNGMDAAVARATASWGSMRGDARAAAERSLLQLSIGNWVAHVREEVTEWAEWSGSLKPYSLLGDKWWAWVTTDLDEWFGAPHGAKLAKRLKDALT